MSRHHFENTPVGVDPSVRMTGNERLQHIVMFFSFTILAISGFTVHLPRAFVRVFGEEAPVVFDFRGTLHRVSGIVLVVAGIYHLFYLAFTRRGRWQFRQLLPRKRDLSDFVAMTRYYRSPATTPKPEFGWYNYMEKAEYWALVWGTFIMGLTGFALWMEEYVPKVLLDLSLVIHRYEAILAVLAVLVWHFYHVHLAPDVFPMSPVWLTGRERDNASTAEG
jgi:cytochrome b subunit of formate dehydrogenase